MAQTTAQAFAEMDSRIRLTDDQQQVVDTRRGDVEEMLRRDFHSRSPLPLVGTTVFGSAGRDTIIQPLDEVDVMVVFSAVGGGWDAFSERSEALLACVQETLHDYETEVIGTHGRALRLIYSTPPDVHIVPVFTRGEGAYLLPVAGGGWQPTEPELHAELVREGGTHLASTVRLLKYWSRLHGSRLRAYHLETFAVRVAAGRSAHQRDALVRVFGLGAHGLNVAEPAGHGGDLSGYLDDTERGLLRQTFGYAHAHAEQALAAERAGRQEDAIGLWREVFGAKFPPYG